MLFSSPVFFLFFAVYFLVHVCTPLRWRNFLIIAGSTVFYAWWKLDYIWLPYLLMTIAFVGARWSDNAATQPSRKRRLIISIIVLFLPLLLFKYTDFIARDVLGIAEHKLVDISLPLGVSFLTFTLTAYMVDIYRRQFPSNQKYSTVLAYTLFFPHLIAGPILRPAELIPQLEANRRKRIMFIAAIAIFTLGLVKKLLFADQLGVFVDSAYETQGAIGAPQALMALYGFTVQIYCDFSGYTDMAIGLAMLLGLRLPNNFLRPYASASLTEFWRRWHITLSFWLRDYLYIPLGGNRRGFGKTLRNIMITMVLGGLWHGANWTFVVWGAMHGAGIAFMHVLKHFNLRLRMPRWLAVVLTFHFVTIAWAFFRAPNVASALSMLAAPFEGSWAGLTAFVSHAAFGLVLLAVFVLTHACDDHRRIKRLARRLRPEMLWPLLVFFWILAITVSQGSSAKFVYFDF